MATTASMSDPDQQQASPQSMGDAMGGPVPQVGAPSPAVTVSNNPAPSLSEHVARHDMIARLLDQVGSALGGTKTFDVQHDAQGNATLTPRNKTTGEKWRSIAQAALAGAGAGASVGPGGAGLIRAAGAGQQAGVQVAQAQRDRQQQQLQQAQQQQQVAQQAMLHSANMAHLNQQTHIESLDAANRQATFEQGQADRMNQFSSAATAEPDSIDLGHFKTSQEAAEALAKNPEYVQHHVEGAMHLNPDIDDSGKVTGYHGVYMAKPFADRHTEQDFDIPQWTTDPKTGRGSVTYTTQKAGSDTNGATSAKVQAGNVKVLTGKKEQDAADAKAREDASQAQLRAAQGAAARSEVGKNQAEAQKARGEAGGGGEGATGDMQKDAEMMYEGRVAPSQLSKRAGYYNALLPRADAYGMTKYGKHFDAEASEARFKTRQATMKDFADGKPADQISSFNTFLGHAENLSDTIDQLRNANSPLLNLPLKELRKAMGDARYAAIAPQIEAVRTERENFLNNNHALQAPQIKGGEELLNDNQSLAQSQAAIKAFGSQAVTRVGTLNDRHKRVMGEDVPQLLNDTSQRTIRKLGLDKEARTALGTAYAQPITVTAPDGSTHPFETQAQADNFKRLAGIK